MQIDFWQEFDEGYIKRMLKSFLQETYEVGYDFPPTENNVMRFWDIGIKAAGRKDPTLVAYTDGILIGFCLWVGVPPQHILDVRDKVCLGMGTYMIPKYRNLGLATALREAAHAVAKSVGYTRIDGYGYYEAPKKLMEANGWKHVACVYHKEL